MTNPGEDNFNGPQGESLNSANAGNEGAESTSAPSGTSGTEQSGAGDTDFEAFEQDLGEDSVLLQTQKRLEQAEEDLARARADVYNVNQEYGNYVRRSKSEAGQRRGEGQQDAIEALLPVLDDIEAARAAGELTEGPFASIATKLEETLNSRFGLERYGNQGDGFDPQLHDALMAQPNPDVDHPVVGQVLQPGYKINDRILRPTKVLVFNPE